MDLNNILELTKYGLGGVVIILAGMIKIPKKEINCWSWLFRTLGRAINGEVIEKVDKIKAELDKHIQMEEESEARAARQRFLRFNDDILEGKKHSKEHFDEILGEIDKYIDYCLEHPAYENSKAELAIANIRKSYQECMEEHKFL